MNKSKIKHTPGPWTSSIGSSGACIHVANDFNHPLSFGFQYSEIDLEQQVEGQANARLIAAAPDLLEVCELLVEIGTGTAKEGDHQLFSKANNLAKIAIARATGNEK